MNSLRLASKTRFAITPNRGRTLFSATVASRDVAQTNGVFEPVLKDLSVKTLATDFGSKSCRAKMARSVLILLILLASAVGASVRATAAPAATAPTALVAAAPGTAARTAAVDVASTRQIQAPNQCSDLFYPSFHMASATMIPLDARITEQQLKNVAQLKTELDQGVLRYFRPHRDLKIRVGLGEVQPFFYPNVHALDLPYSYPVTFFKPKAQDADRYYSKKEIPFRTADTFVHEYTHSVLDLAFQDRIPGYREFRNSPVRIELENLGSDEKIRKRIRGDQQLLSLIHTIIFAHAYDEFLADLAVSIQFKDPKKPSKGIQEHYLRSYGRLRKILLGKWAYVDQYRDFDTKYEKDLALHHPSLVTEAHWLLGPTRSATWNVYLKNRARVSDAIFFRAVVDAVMSEIIDVFASDQTIFTVDTADSLVTPQFGVQTLNDRLTRRIEALKFD